MWNQRSHESQGLCNSSISGETDIHINHQSLERSESSSLLPASIPPPPLVTPSIPLVAPHLPFVVPPLALLPTSLEVSLSFSLLSPDSSYLLLFVLLPFYFSLFRFTLPSFCCWKFFCSRYLLLDTVL